MANPQTEDGYTKIANELLDAMCRLHLSGNQWKVLHTIIRKTYGWNKKVDFLTGTQIADMTGMHSTHVYAALRVLRERRVITWHKKLIAVQKDYDQWKVTETCHSDKNLSQAQKRQKPVTRVTETCHEKVTETCTHKRKKDTISKDKEGRKKKAPKTLPKSEAVLAFRSVMKLNPRKAQEPMIDEVVTDIPLWERCLEVWMRKGYNPMNIDGPLDWYKKGGPPHSGPKARGGNVSQSLAANEEAGRRLKEMGL